MMLKKLILCFGLLLIASGALWASELPVKSIRLQPLGSGEAKLTVTLEVSASLSLFYDELKPTSPEVLETFWYRQASKERSTTHSFFLQELEEGQRYYFRLASVWPSEMRTQIFDWFIPRDSQDDIVIK